ncbi:MAG TPA: alpha/beta hydrolase [Thermoanaerobaculia bacterium]
MKARAYRYPYRRRRPRGGLLWMLLGLLGLGALAAALFAKSRREDEEERKAAAPPPPHPDTPEDDVPEAAPPESASMWVAGPAGNLFVRDGGDASSAHVPIVFVHSLAGNGGQWALQLDHLRRHRRALALDLRGHGDSDPADNGNYTIPALASDIAAVVDQLSLRRFVLAGHSLGSAAAIEYAAQHPERVAGLLLVDPNGDMTRVPRDQFQPFLDSLRRDPLDELTSYYRQILVGGDPDASRWVLEDLQLTHEDAIPSALEGSLNYPPLPALERYTGPKLSVISDMNSLPYSLHNLVPDLPTRLMPGTGHWLMMDRPEVFNRILDEFLAEVEETLTP